MVEELISKVWALEPRFHNVQATLLLKRLNSGYDYSAIKEGWKAIGTLPMFKAMAAADGEMKPNYVAMKSGNVAIISIIGSMTRYGGLCSKGTEAIGGEIIEANNDPTVSAIVLYLNTPGGEVDGTELLGDIVKNSSKPIISYVVQAASAGYWVASQAREIVMESETTSEVGSVGVLAIHVDSSKHYEKEGHAYTIVRSDGSEDKALFNSLEPLNEDILGGVKSELNVIRGTFVQKVKSGRPNIDDDVFTGKMYIGKVAIKKGMADRIGYLGDAVQRADLLARKGN